VLGDRYASQFETLKNVFKGMWSLEDYETDQEVQDIVAKVIDNPKNYVVKP
jgi:hypothetical protein